MLDEIAERLDRAIRYEHYIHARCPWHSPDHNPSFFVYKDYYFCASCEAKGPTNKLLDRLSGRVIFKESVSIFNPFREWLKRFSDLRETLKFAYKYGQTFPIYLDYVYNRGITKETVRETKLGYLDRFITIPLVQNKRIVGAVARSVKEKHYFIPKEQNPNILFIPNEVLFNESDTVYLVFGMFDCLTLYQYGLPAMTTTRGIVRSEVAFQGIRKRIIVIPDKGEEKTGSRLVAQLDWRGKLLLLDYPIGTKDINDLHVRGYEEMIHGLASGF